MAGPDAMIANIFARFPYIVVEGTPPVLLPMCIGDFRFSSLTMCASKLAIVLRRFDVLTTVSSGEHFLNVTDLCFVCFVDFLFSQYVI